MRPDQDQVAESEAAGAKERINARPSDTTPVGVAGGPRRRIVMDRRPLGRWLLVGLLVGLLLAGCGSDRPPARSPALSDDPGLVHVHGLGINPADGTLYAATHTGLFTVRDGAASRVGDHLQDTMGFTVVGPDHFLGSGHPDVRDTQLYQPGRRPLLGLIESRDAGRSWRPLSLLGQADFHALQVAHGLVYGYDATGRRFMVSADRRNWQVRSRIELLGVAVSPTDPQLVIATTGRRLLRSTEGGRTWQPTQGPALLVLDWAGPDAMWGAAADGQVWRSRDAGGSWRRAGRLGGQPEALLAHQGRLYAAVMGLGIVSSVDGGRSWQVRYQPGQPAG